MEIQSRKRNSLKNVSYGLLVTIISVIVSFINRTYLVKFLGIEPLGLNGLFTEVITMMSLAELGIGMAITYSLYKPIHENNIEKINQLMSLFKSTYNIIASIVFALGIIILPFIHLIVNGTNFSVGYIRLVFFLFVVNSASTYLFSYNTSFINANQKQYVVSLVSTLWKVVFTAINVILLCLFENYILYLLLLILQTLCTNLYLTYYVRKKYPFITYKEDLPSKEKTCIFQDIKNIFVKRLSGVITSSTTNILISTFVNTIQVGLYSNYIMIFSVVRTLKIQFSNAIKASVGDLSVSEKPEKCICILRQLTFLFFMFSIIVCGCLLSISNDFITIWLGKNYVMGRAVVAIAIYNLYLELISEPLWQYLEVSGLFKQDKYIGLAGSSLNLLVALIGGYYVGIIGIFLGTVATQILQMILKTRLLFKYKYNKQYSSYLFIILRMMIAIVISSYIIFLLDKIIVFDNIYIMIFIKGIVTIVISAIIGILTFIRTREIKDCYKMIKFVQL